MKRMPFHDWTLSSVAFDWTSGTVSLVLRFHDAEKIISADGTSELHIRQLKPWGPSVSINEATHHADDAQQRLDIEMQSGDVITIAAKMFRFPD